MKLKFWGSRGSLPSPITLADVEQKLLTALIGAQGVDLSDRRAVKEYIAGLPPLTRGTAGGNTSCVSIQVGDEWIILDAGSGLRALGEEMMKGEFGRGRGVAHVFITHTHWDHVQGFPFFRPVRVLGNRITMYSPIPNLEQRFRGQQTAEYFPVSLEQLMRADVSFVKLDENVPITVAGVQVNNILQAHPGRSYGYRLDGEGARIVYATDAEYKNLGEAHTQRYVEFMEGADLLIFDAQYTLKESFQRVDWGHSSSIIGVDMAVRANVKQLVLFHFDPSYGDDRVQEILDTTMNYIASDPDKPKCEIFMAIEGLEFELGRSERTILKHRFIGDAAVLTINGRFDASVASQVDEQLTALISDGPEAGIVVDLSEVTHLSVAGLKTLLTAQQMGHGWPLVLAAAPENVRKVLDQVGFAETFVQYDSVENAMSALEARQYLQLQGQALHSRYRVESKLYAGQKATLFKAFDIWFERPVTVKVLPKSGGKDGDQAVLREARAAARLNHPNIGAVYDCVEHRDRLYLVREFVEGMTLSHLLSRLENDQGLPPTRILGIGKDILKGLTYAHRHSVLHRYLRPKNVILSENTLKIFNFGLTDDPEEEWSLGDVVYLAPEQLAQEEPTERSDLYSFGVIMYELIARHPPFVADSVEELIRLRMHHEPISLCESNPNLPLALDRIILTLLDKNPDHRYPSATMVLDALEGIELWESDYPPERDPIKSSANQESEGPLHKG